MIITITVIITALRTPTSARWVFSCFRNPRHRTLTWKYRIFNVRVRTYNPLLFRYQLVVYVAIPISSVRRYQLVVYVAVVTEVPNKYESLVAKIKEER